nr:transposon Ty3-I Gag-Pol polyprotein [Tanacetum cinerariifolium]
MMISGLQRRMEVIAMVFLLKTLKYGFMVLRVINRRNEGRHGYGDQQRYRVKAAIPNFLENVDLEALVD